MTPKKKAKKIVKKVEPKKKDPVAAPPSDDKVTFVTKEGLKQLQDEYGQLTTVSRKEVAKRLEEAISYGDLSENAEYEEAKNEQAFLEARIVELEDKIKYAKIITHKKGKVVELGSDVVIKRMKPREGDNEEYTIVGSTEADPLGHRISNESPIGAALLDHKVGDLVEARVPAGKVTYKIVKLK